MSKRVLIVDDSRVGRKMVKRSLPDDWDIDLSEAGDGQQAIDYLGGEDFDVVFLDLTMPIVDGYDVLRWLKNHDLDPIVIVISGDVQPEAKVRVLLLGAFEFVPKPPDKEVLERILKLAGVLK